MPGLPIGNYYASLGNKYAYFYAAQCVNENPAFYVGSKYLTHGIYGSSKTNIPSSKYWWPCIALLPPIVIFMTEQNSIWSKALIMPLSIWHCVFFETEERFQ